MKKFLLPLLLLAGPAFGQVSTINPRYLPGWTNGGGLQPALGFTPLNKAGDTATGPFTFNLPAVTGGNGTAGYQQFQFNLMSGDTWNGGFMPANNVVAVNARYGGGQGGRQTLAVTGNRTAAPGAACSLTNLCEDVALVGFMTASAGFGGTNGSEAGSLYGMNSLVQTLTGANYLYNVTTEFDIDTRTTGGAPREQSILSLVSLSTHATQASVYDAALLIGAAQSSVGMKTGVLFSCHYNWINCQQPVSQAGSLIATEGSWTVATGIDLSSVTTTTGAFKSNNFLVNPTGDVYGRSFRPGAGTFVNNTAQFYTDTAKGTVITGQTGSTGGSDLLLTSAGGASVLSIPFGTSDLLVGGHLFATALGTAPATGTVSGSLCVSTTGSIYIKTTTGPCL